MNPTSPNAHSGVFWGLLPSSATTTVAPKSKNLPTHFRNGQGLGRVGCVSDSSSARFVPFL